MNFNYQEMLRIIRSASFNDEMASELLLELGRHAPACDLAYRFLDIAGHMSAEAKSLAALYQPMAAEKVSSPRN
ncbi:hypothetical protein N5J43_14290 [Pseudomonas nicosulfuronedens]|uniref:Uncharacterized protein n=1 Tax=Pseudomonas nicosulfuronedens TaxID=2571105 RepID=A0A5R9RAB0_9PSED|nr:hypothetical protein [Pseudomonas nicosulfuronedens]MDH1010107.1 hypothetical protein [Pseudomonas nicosulfuronedens]MDH1980123.1 hypothetical protein [Pseudomonas nicosulfuronedens]MDH2025342.1 hypothetical protein [Pseudomonas nicosulfuronedens]TLX78751.1 hypothetical protein FAS41_09420 [Pseudomonas nicosulfuronedens]